MIIDTLMVIWGLIRRANLVKVLSLVMISSVSILLVSSAIGLPMFSRQSSLDSHALMRKVVHNHTLMTIRVTPTISASASGMTPVLSSVHSVLLTVVPAPASAVIVPTVQAADSTCTLPMTPVPPPTPVLPTVTVSLFALPTTVVVVPTVSSSDMGTLVPTALLTPTASDMSTVSTVVSTATPLPSVLPTIVATTASGNLPGTITVMTATPSASPKSSIGEMEQKTPKPVVTGSSSDHQKDVQHSVPRHQPSLHISHTSAPPSRGKVNQGLDSPTLHCLQTRG